MCLFFATGESKMTSSNYFQLMFDSLVKTVIEAQGTFNSCGSLFILWTTSMPLDFTFMILVHKLNAKYEEK